MPRRCTVCDHPERHSIDEALVTGAPYRCVAKRFVREEAAGTKARKEAAGGVNDGILSCARP
jgi:hypothetical protein